MGQGPGTASAKCGLILSTHVNEASKFLFTIVFIGKSCKQEFSGLNAIELAGYEFGEKGVAELGEGLGFFAI